MSWVDDRVGLAEEHPVGPVGEARDPLEDRLLGPGGEALHGAQPAGLGRRAELVQCVDAELVVDEPDRARPHARQLEHLHEGRWDLGPEAVVEAEAAGRDDLGDLVGDRLADAGDPRPRPAAVRLGDVDRAVGDGVGRPVIGHGLEDELALDLEHVADLVEDPGEVAVRQGGGVEGRSEGRRIGRCRVGRAIDPVIGGHRPMVAGRPTDRISLSSERASRRSGEPSASVHPMSERAPIHVASRSTREGPAPHRPAGLTSPDVLPADSPGTTGQGRGRTRSLGAPTR